MTGDGVVAVEEHLACVCNVVVIHNGLNVVDRSSGNAGAENGVDCLLDGVVLGPILDDLLELCLMLKAGCGHAVGLCLGQLGLVEHLGAQKVKQLVVAAADDELAVLCLEGVVGSG